MSADSKFSGGVKLPGFPRPECLRLGIDVPSGGLLDDLGLARLAVGVPLVPVRARGRDRSRVVAFEGRNIGPGDLVQFVGFLLKDSGRLGGAFGRGVVGGSL